MPEFAGKKKLLADINYSLPLDKRRSVRGSTSLHIHRSE